MGESRPRNGFLPRMVNSGRLLFEGQAKGRNERPSADHDEERQAGNGGHVPKLRHQDLQDRESCLNSGRLLLKGQAQGRDAGSSSDHDEEWQAGNGGHVPDLRHQDLQDRQIVVIRPRERTAPRERSFLSDQVVIGGSSAPSNTSVAETASSTPSALKISTLDGLLTRATVFLTLK